MTKKQSALTGPGMSDSLVVLVPNKEQNKSSIQVGKSMARKVAEFYNEVFPWFGEFGGSDDIDNLLYEDLMFDDIDEDDDDSFRY
jgi:hypothetical protein